MDSAAAAPGSGRVYVTWLRENLGGAEGDIVWHAHQEGGDGAITAQTQTSTAEDAVTWGRRRSDWVLVAGGDGAQYWAGSAARPDDITLDWDQAPAQAREL